MKSFKYILCVTLFALAIAAAPADNWYVCLGSFKSIDNTRQFSVVLTEGGLPNAVSVHNATGGTLYRVLYDKPFERRNEARIFRDELLDDTRIHLLNLSGLWICEAKPIDEKTAAGEVLQKNDEEVLPVSEEKPYSLKVRSYKEEHPAQQNSERLRANNIDAYVVKTYDDNAYFSFDVHAGAFTSPEESAETADALVALGIEDVTLSNYADIKEKMLRYDEVVQQDNVVFETAENATLPEFSEAVQICLADLPVNKNFLIESIAIVDFETLAAAGGRDLNRFKSLATPGDLNLDDFETLTTEYGIHAMAKAVYLDDLFGKRVEVCVIESAETFSERDFDIDGKNGTEVQFSLTGDDILYAHISSDDTVRSIAGLNANKTLFITIDAYDFSEDEFEQFLNNAWSDSAMVIYPQLRKSLCILPKTREGRKFAAFTLSRVDKSYAVEKGYAEWAIPIVGHWEASGYFLQDDEEVEVSFFDMDYAHNAQKVHRMFMDNHKGSIFSDYNHPATVCETEAWYVKAFGKEISFSIKSFIVAVDTDINSSIGEDELNAFASELTIWEQ